MQSLHIQCQSHEYPIYIGENILTQATLSQHIVGKTVCIVTNDTVEKLYLNKIKACLEAFQCDVVVLPDGEAYKTLASWEKILETMLGQHHHRNTTCLSLGGGVIGDLTGFAASCYQRGVNFIQVPTTLLSQVDASIGGKTAVNHPLGKNMIGTFHQPQAVFIDIQTLTTLPEDEFACGMAEIIKAAMIADADFFQWLQDNQQAIDSRDKTTLIEMIKRSCQIKATIVSQDEKEAGVRALLNFGHTFGHAIEQVMGYGKIKHGEAVAIGMICACDLAERINLCEAGLTAQCQALCERFQLPVKIPRKCSPKALYQAMKLDKKNIDTAIRLILPKAIGSLIITDDYSIESLQHVLQSN